jgi:hypothetical protein
MSLRLDRTFSCLLASAAMLVATGAFADITVYARYTLINGDTLTRASYYSPKRMRITAPDGREYIFQSKEKRVGVIDHARQLYWEGPMSRADSIVDRLNAERYQELMANVTEDQKARWAALVSTLNDSIQVREAWEERKIAGYPCARWTTSVGSRMAHERWIARSLDVRNFSEDIQRIVLASVPDPLGSAFARMIIQASSVDGLPLATSATFRTLTVTGSYSWEAFRVGTDRIPDSAWEVPKDYRRAQWSDVSKKAAP